MPSLLIFTVCVEPPAVKPFPSFVPQPVLDAALTVVRRRASAAALGGMGFLMVGGDCWS